MNGFRLRASSGSRHGVPVTTEDKKEHGWPHRLVVVEGVIGVGKTSLARKLAAAVGAGPLFDHPLEKPLRERV